VAARQAPVMAKNIFRLAQYRVQLENTKGIAAMKILLALNGLVFFFAVLSGCTRNSLETSKVKINFSSAGLSGTTSKTFIPAAARTTGWSSTVPSTLADIQCYAVFVGADQAGYNEGYCNNVSSQEIIRFGRFVGLVSRDQTAEFELSPGPGRTIYILGATSDDGKCEPMGPTGELTEENYSQPVLIGKAYQDLPPGTVNITIKAEAKFDDDHFVSHCRFPGAVDSINQCVLASSWSTIDIYEKSPGVDAMAMSVTVDSSGTIYAGGSAGNLDYTDLYWTIRKSSDGGASWTTMAEVQSEPNTYASVYGLGIFSGILFAVGWDFTPTDGNWFTRKSSDGGTTWSDSDPNYTYSGGYSVAKAVARAPNGNVYVVGNSSDASYYRGVIRKASSVSSNTWTTVFSYLLDPMGATEFNAISVGGDGKIWVVGSATDSTANQHWVVFVSSDDGATWTQVDDYQGDSVSHGMAFSVSVLGSDVFVSGQAVDGSGDAIWIVRKSSDDGATWTNADEFSPIPGYWSYPRSIVEHKNGNLYVGGIGGSSWVIRKSSDRGATWVTDDDFTLEAGGYGDVNSLSVDSTGNIYAAGNATISSAPLWVVRKLSCE
jgi:hypothetical protein